MLQKASSNSINTNTPGKVINTPSEENTYELGTPHQRQHNENILIDDDENTEMLIQLYGEQPSKPYLSRSQLEKIYNTMQEVRKLVPYSDNKTYTKPIPPNKVEKYNDEAMEKNLDLIFKAQDDIQEIDDRFELWQKNNPDASAAEVETHWRSFILPAIANVIEKWQAGNCTYKTYELMNKLNQEFPQDGNISMDIINCSFPSGGHCALVFNQPKIENGFFPTKWEQFARTSWIADCHLNIFCQGPLYLQKATDKLINKWKANNKIMLDTELKPVSHEDFLYYLSECYKYSYISGLTHKATDAVTLPTEEEHSSNQQ